MFTRKTVFVVGAGASRELGLPVGEGLMKTIAKKLDIAYRNGFDVDRGDRTIISTVLEKCRQRHEHPNLYFQAGRSISEGMAQAISIDNYLHTHANDAPIVEMGKMAIALSIIEAERLSKLYADDRRANLAGAAASWLIPFFQMMHEGVTRENAAAVFDNISVVCFNYDRCIEYFIRNALKIHFRIAEDETDQLMKRFTVVHPYGEIGMLSATTPFGAELNIHTLPEVASNIRTFTEQVYDDAAQTAVRISLEEAECVVFLGFSYNELNLQFMAVDRAQPPLVFGTSLGLSEPNVRVIEGDLEEMFGVRRMFDEGIPTNLHVVLEGLSCREFLDAYRRPIMRGGF